MSGDNSTRFLQQPYVILVQTPVRQRPPSSPGKGIHPRAYGTVLLNYYVREKGF